MEWITLTEARIQNRLTAPELVALRTAAIAASQTSSGILAAGIAAVTAEVRGYVGVKNTLGAVGTIPEELETAALALLRRYLFTRLPGMKGLFDELRQQEVKDALRILQDVAAGKFVIVAPTTEAEEQAGGNGTQLISSRTRVATRETMAGL